MIHTRGKDMLFIEAHGHCWNELHGRRFDTKKLLPLDYEKYLLVEKRCSLYFLRIVTAE